jgi:hypothetical protein
VPFSCVHPFRVRPSKRRMEGAGADAARSRAQIMAWVYLEKAVIRCEHHETTTLDSNGLTINNHRDISEGNCGQRSNNAASNSHSHATSEEALPRTSLPQGSAPHAIQAPTPRLDGITKSMLGGRLANRLLIPIDKRKR